MAVIRFAEDSFLDAEMVNFITGSYTDKDKNKWKTDLIINGVPISIEGEPGKNIMEAFIWQRKYGITDMIPGETYQKKLFK